MDKYIKFVGNSKSKNLIISFGPVNCWGTKYFNLDSSYVMLVRNNNFMTFVDEKKHEDLFSLLLQHMKSLIDRIKPKYTISYGSSAGGFLALLYGHHLKVNEIHALNPFSTYDHYDPDLDIYRESGFNGTKWDINSKQISDILKPDLEKTELLNLTNIVFSSNAYVYYSNGVIDQFNAIRLIGVTLIHVNDKSHLAPYLMFRYFKIYDKIFDGSFDEFIKKHNYELEVDPDILYFERY
jgi:hypothetical protein